MGDTVQDEWTGFRRTSWGPVHLRVRRGSVEATVGDATVALDVTDRRSGAEQRANPFHDPFAVGVPVTVNGRQLATVIQGPPRTAGLFLRRARYEVTGDESFVLPQMRFTHRLLPSLVTLRSEAGTLVATRPWTALYEDFAWHYSFPGGNGLMAPRVAPGTRPEHVAFWFAMRQVKR